MIVISARVALSDRLVGLDEGADDYLAKPFAMAELISRLRAVHRRHARQASERWQCGALELSLKSQRAWLHGEAIDLSPREFNILQVLAKNPDSVVSKRELCRRVQPLGEPVEESTIEVHMSNLRKKSVVIASRPIGVLGINSFCSKWRKRMDLLFKPSLKRRLVFTLLMGMLLIWGMLLAKDHLGYKHKLLSQLEQGQLNQSLLTSLERLEPYQAESAIAHTHTTFEQLNAGSEAASKASLFSVAASEHRPTVLVTPGGLLACDNFVARANHAG